MKLVDYIRPADASAEWTPEMQDALETAVARITHMMLDEFFTYGRQRKASETTVDGECTIVPPPMLPAPSESA